MRRNIIIIAATFILFFILTGAVADSNSSLRGAQALFAGLSLTAAFAGLLMLVIGGFAILAGEGGATALLPGSVTVLAAATITAQTAWGAPLSLALLLATVVACQLVSPFDNEPETKPKTKPKTTRKRTKKKA